MIKKQIEKLKMEALEVNALDQDKKYDISGDELKQANNAITDSKASKIKKKKREPLTLEEIDIVWRLFKQPKYSNDFKALMGYGVEEIERIGYAKFIEAMDWTIDNVKNFQWRKDVVKMLICSECGDEFTTFQLDYGVCDKCKPRLDLDRFYKYIEAQEKASPGTSDSTIMLFTFYKEFRDMFRFLSDDEAYNVIVGGNFTDPNAIFLIMEAIKDNKKELLNKVQDVLVERIKEKPHSSGRLAVLNEYIASGDVEGIEDFFINLEIQNK